MQIFKSFTPEVVKLIKNGAVGVIPTDTIYGVVALLANQNAIERIFELKKRDLNKRVGTTLISDITQIETLVNQGQLVKAQTYWPGPVSIEMEVTPQLSYAHRGHGTMAFRIPNNEAILRLLQQTGPLSTSSANHAGDAPATNVQDALRTFGESIDFYVDGGDLSHRKPSKVIRINEDGETEIIRGDTK